MKSLTVRLPDELVQRLEAEARERSLSKSDIVRERLTQSSDSAKHNGWSDVLAKVVGSVDDLQSDLSANKQTHLTTTGHDRNRHR